MGFLDRIDIIPLVIRKIAITHFTSNMMFLLFENDGHASKIICESMNYLEKYMFENTEFEDDIKPFLCAIEFGEI